MTLFELLCSMLIGGVAVAGMQWGIFGLFVGLVIGYIILCILENGLFALCGTRRGEVADEHTARLANRGWCFYYPVCDIRTFASLPFYFAPVTISLGGVLPRVCTALHTEVSPFCLGGICAAVLSMILSMAGLLIIWQWTFGKLEANEQVLSSLSKPSEIVVCHALLITGFWWMAVASYLPIWVVSWILD